MDEFMVPENVEELWQEESQLPLKVLQLIDYSEESPQEISEISERLAFVLCDQDPLCIVEQQNFDQLASLLRCWELIEGSKRRQLVDSLCSSLTCLNAWTDKLLSQPPDSVDKDSVVTHRSAFKAYIFFLQWLSSMSAREAREGQMASSMSAATSTSGRGGGRKKKSASEAAGWDWSSQLPKVMKSVSQAMSADLWALFRPSRPDDAILARVALLAAAAFAEPGSAKDPELAASASTVLAVCALRYGQMESVTSTMVELINVYEHTPPLVAELLRHSVSTFNDGRLVGALVAELSAVDPVEYERQQNATGEKAGVRSVANFIEELAARCPKLLAGQMALLLPHLGGRAWSLRSGIIAAIGHLIAQAFIDVSNESGDQQRLAALRAKQHLLDVLVERTRDQSSFTRKAVLATWAALSEQRAVPLGHWSTVTEIAIGRLEDKSSLVRKEALRLLQALMLHNPFGPSLPVDRFAATLGTHKDMLDQLFPPEEDGMQQVVNLKEENGEEVEEKKESGVAVEDNDADGMEVEQDQGTDKEDEQEKKEEKTEEEGHEQQQGEEEEAPPSAPQPKCSPADVGWDGSVEELQALVASLELAVDFARSLTNSMPITTQLLASSTVSDVQESIAFLLTCKQFEVDGAPEAIRCMLPLIFSRDQAIKDKIVEALDQLYMSGWAGALLTSAQAARALVSLASGASLGELGALEECVKEFITRGKMTPVHVHELWELATRAHAALVSGVAGAQRAQRDLRAALAVLSMAAAARPELFNSQHISAFLQYGFDFKIVADALTTRHACTALTCLENSFKSGMYDSSLEAVYSALVATVVSSPLTDSSWFSAAESAITALYCLHPAPEHLVSSILKHMARQAFSQSQSVGVVGTDDATTEMTMEPMEDAMMNEDGDDDQPSPPPPPAGVPKTAVHLNVCGDQDVQSSTLSRFMFILGHSGLQHLVYVEKVCKAVRKARNDAEKRMAEDKADRATAAAQKNNKKSKKKRKSKNDEDGSEEEEGSEEEVEEEEEDDDDDINAELGVGSVAADAELDASKEAAEKQLLRSASSVLAPYARLVSALCHSRILLSCDTTLRSSALLALTKLMIVDIEFCEANLQLLFTLLQNRSVEPALRSNLIIALGDLALRFPNALEPWTEHVYRPLGDPDSSVRKNALMVLTHLILNDMMKVKGHIAKVAVCLEDEDSRVSALARLFFHELAKKEYKGTSPIYNLLPDILSNLSREPRLNRASFQSVMQQLLAYIKKDKQGDALTDKLCQRFAATDDPGQWRNIAFCLTQLPISDKGLKRLADGFKLYKHSLHDAEVAAAFAGIVTKAKKGEKKPEVKAVIDDLEAKVAAYIAELAADDDRGEGSDVDVESGGKQDGATTAAAAENQNPESAQQEADQSDSLIAGMCDIKIQDEQSEMPRGKVAKKKEKSAAAAESEDDDATESDEDDDDENVSMQQSHAPSGGRGKRGQVPRQSAADSEDESMVMDDDEVSVAHNTSSRKQTVDSEDDEEEEEEDDVEMEEEEDEEEEERPKANRGGRRKATAASGGTRPGRATRKSAVVEGEDSEDKGEEYIAAIKAEHV